jgi:pimeloyl-ACP methyl ester carboxylesterase
MRSGWGRLSRHGFITLAAFVLGGCGVSPKTEVPIPVISQVSPDQKNKTLIVMLPGRGDRASSFVSAGFLETVDKSDVDVVAVDAHFGYYKERSLVPRLHEDVIGPAIENGYESIWLVGVSMGGMGSLLYADQHRDLVSRIVLLAPYLGDPGIVTEIEAAGGLAAWNADSSPFQAHEVAVWRWLQASRNGPDAVPVYLGYGKSDRFAGNYAALQHDIDALKLYTEDGGHKWTTWSRLWSRLYADLATDAFAKDR